MQDMTRATISPYAEYMQARERATRRLIAGGRGAPLPFDVDRYMQTHSGEFSATVAELLALDMAVRAAGRARAEPS